MYVGAPRPCIDMAFMAVDKQRTCVLVCVLVLCIYIASSANNGCEWIVAIDYPGRETDTNQYIRG